MNTTSEIACINSALSLIDDSISNLLDKCDVIRLKIEKIEKEAIPTKRLPKDNAKQIKDTLDKVKFIDEYTRTAVNEGTVMAKENKDV